MPGSWLPALLDAAAPLLRPAFGHGAFTATWLEIVAFALSVAMVLCNQRVHPAGWPLAMAASALYALLFAASGLYGEASLQLFFIAMAAWGWSAWLRNRGGATTRGVSVMPPRERTAALVATALLWAALAWLLHRATDSTVPVFDALPTAGSVTATWLLGRKRIENWPAWLAINAVSTGLFAYKGLWLTVLLYALFCAMAWRGWQAWRARLAPGTVPGTAS